MILHQARIRYVNAFQGAIFICGLPPYDTDNHQFLLADEVTTRIKIPSAHIVGSVDLARTASLALYNVCDRETSVFFDHGKGHTIPCEGRSLIKAAAAIREVQDRILMVRAQEAVKSEKTKL